MMKLYTIPLSHAAATARLMVEYKGLGHETVEIVSGLHPVWLRLRGFSRTTVPALRADRERVQGTLQIARFLDRHTPEPALFPADPAARREVEQAEAWG